MKNDSFFTRVYSIVQKIPKGRVTSYGAIAEYLGAKKSARMVGWAMNASNHYYPPIPAHRVVNRNGMLTGKNHFSNPTLMQKLLENEGVEIVDDRILHFEKIFWKPGKKVSKSK